METLGILVCNRKGGVGKSTVSTNLAALFARHGWNTVLMDCDGQGSAMDWAAGRPPDEPLTAIDAHSRQGVLAPAIRLRMPPNAECVIYDAPAGASGNDLADLLRRVNLVLVPLMPSAIDLAATETFLQELQRQREVRIGKVKIGVIANRIRDGQVSTRALRGTVAGWNVPVLAEFRDTQLYVMANGMCRAIHELKSPRAEPDRDAWSAFYDRIFRLVGAAPTDRAGTPSATWLSPRTVD